MGDLPSGSCPQALETATTGFAQDGSSSASAPYRLADKTSPFHSQLSPLPQAQLRPDMRANAPSASHYQNQEYGVSTLNMGSMASALPEQGVFDDGFMNQSIQRSLPGGAAAVPYQLPQNVQLSTSPSYGAGFASNPYQHNYMPAPGAQHGQFPAYGANATRIGGAPSMQPQYQNYPQAGQYMYYPAPYGAQGQFMPGFPAQVAHAQGMYGRRPSMSNGSAGVLGQSQDFSRLDRNSSNTHPNPAMAQGEAGFGAQYGAHFVPQGIPRSPNVSSIPRGPPRKPKQSGHALWVGNLPPGTTVVALKDHFSREATKDIESLFLISKSNCAFVNYRTESSCTAAMHRFHDSRFNGVRLVCRLRRSSTPASGVPTGPSAMVGSPQPSQSPPATPKQDAPTEPAPSSETPKITNGQDDKTADISSKYFIVKSLTLQDLELSVRNGIWATQSHNEESLNKAFQSTDNVYLIFSANKSGEYFGYARMASPILEDGSQFVSQAPKPTNIIDSTDVPKSIPTPATEWAPRGRIIDDSARGTIFWEAELSDEEGEEDSAEKDDTTPGESEQITAQSWGKPFKVEWMSTNRLPFYRTRGLRNPWNANREVKIARDGTELEPSVGERLVQMFHRMGPAPTAPAMMPGVPPMMPQMRPPY